MSSPAPAVHLGRRRGLTSTSPWSHQRDRLSISALVIEKDIPGVSFGAQERKLGWHSQPTAQVNFDAVRVPIGN